ncbi:hypothetical protein BGZ83_001367 [Gryganskiella cystojenkinii]|nr:hypothetical protein BGZ83_001367 [Gryganskiella cystojenkinii]
MLLLPTAVFELGVVHTVAKDTTSGKVYFPSVRRDNKMVVYDPLKSTQTVLLFGSAMALAPTCKIAVDRYLEHGGSGPGNLDRHCMITVIIFGGDASQRNNSGDIFILNLKTKEWKKGPSLPIIRYDMACTASGDYFIAWGGQNYRESGTREQNFQQFSTPVIFNLKTNLWTSQFVASVPNTGSTTATSPNTGSPTATSSNSGPSGTSAPITDNSQGNTSNSNNTGAIVGGVAGVAVSLAVIGYLIHKKHITLRNGGKNSSGEATYTTVPVNKNGAWDQASSILPVTQEGHGAIEAEAQPASDRPKVPRDNRPVTTPFIGSIVEDDLDNTKVYVAQSPTSNYSEVNSQTDPQLYPPPSLDPQFYAPSPGPQLYPVRPSSPQEYPPTPFLPLSSSLMGGQFVSGGLGHNNPQHVNYPGPQSVNYPDPQSVSYPGPQSFNYSGPQSLLSDPGNDSRKNHPQGGISLSDAVTKVNDQELRTQLEQLKQEHELLMRERQQQEQVRVEQETRLQAQLQAIQEQLER